MDPPKHNTLRASGIPRASRLPVAPSSRKLAHPISFSKPSLPRRDIATPIGSQREQQKPLASSGLSQSNVSALRKQEGSSFPLEQARSEIEGHEAQTELKEEKSTSRLRKPRPSLSDRTMETLSQIPPSPSPRRRKSSLFASQSPMVSPSRSGSSMSNSRPSTSYGIYPSIPSRAPDIRSLSPQKRLIPPSVAQMTPQKMIGQRSASSYVPRGLPPPHSQPNNLSNTTPSTSRTNGPLQSSKEEDMRVQKPARMTNLKGSKTMVVRASKARPPINDAFMKREESAATDAAPSQNRASNAKNKFQNSKMSPKLLDDAASLTKQPETSTPPRSSAALRETIARAKAARRAVSQAQEPSTTIENSFPRIDAGSNNEFVMQRRIATARKDGKLNLAAMGIQELPREILSMYDTNALEIDDGSWAENVDVVKLLAADNEIASLDDEFFPEIRVDAAEEPRPCVFGGLEAMDLHGNILQILPGGFAGLNYLTTLNLSRNRLDNECLKVIQDISSLRELRLAENRISGDVGTALCRLEALEILDASKNAIPTISPDIVNLNALHTINLSGNRLTSLPMEAMACMTLRNIDVSRNGLIGTLLSAGPRTFSELKSLDVSSNALTAISEGLPCGMPALHTLNVSENRLKILPDMSDLRSLITLTAEGNQITALPDGIKALSRLKNVDVSRNNIRLLDDQLGLIDSLSFLHVANNPLRERRLLNMNTQDLISELRNRHSKITDGEVLDEAGEDHAPSSHVTGQEATSSSSKWSIQPGGVVDCSLKGLVDFGHEDFEPLTRENSVKSLILHHNFIHVVPQTIRLAANTLHTLDLSHNKLSGANFLPDELDLPKLKTLNLSANGISNLRPLLSALSAPLLFELNISRNRLTSLPVLREVFSSLGSLFAADNQIAELPVSAVRGLQVLDVSGNAISSLDPKIGLLSQEGLRTFLVGANTFRVPRRDVVDKGTESILTWLRGRIADA